MSRLGEIGLEFGNIIVQPDFEPAQTTLIELWSCVRGRIVDDCREKSSGQLKEQWHRGERFNRFRA